MFKIINLYLITHLNNLVITPQNPLVEELVSEGGSGKSVEALSHSHHHMTYKRRN